MNELIVIFGARVLADGQPSRSLLRRVDAAVEAARRLGDASVLCSGAADGQDRPSEAAVMRGALLRAGIIDDLIILDEASRDTLQSVVGTARLVRERGLSLCLVCSDAYHQPRILALLRLLGISARAVPVRSALRELGVLHWLRMCLREMLALPYDAALVLLKRRSLPPA